MQASMVTVFAVCAVLSLLSLLRAPSEVARTERFAFGILLAASLIAPLSSMIAEVKAWDLSPKEVVSADNPLYEQVMSDAFKDGIAQAVCREFSLPASCVRVTVKDFDAQTMTGHVTVSLTGAAATADHKAVKRFLENEGLGACDVIRETG